MLIVKEFGSDREAGPKEHGLSITREYINERDQNGVIGIGDIITVKLTINGLNADTNYGVIQDELPAGMVPINPSFKNQQYGRDWNDYYSGSFGDYEVTENGMVLSLYRVPAGEKVYTYRARVVSAGSFFVPPASTSLMYAPEIYGTSAAQVVRISNEP